MKNCIWTHPDPAADVDTCRRQLAEIRDAGIDAAVLLVADRRRALYASRTLPVAGRVLEQWLPLAGAAGVALFSRGAMTPAHFQTLRRVLR